MSVKHVDPFKEERLGWMAATFESVSDIVFIADLEDHFIYMNPAALTKLGYRIDEMLGKTAEMIISPNNPEKLRAEMLEATLKPPHMWEGEVINITKSGEEYLAHLKTALVRNRRGEAIGMTGISRDITEQSKARRELEKYTQKLEEVNEMLHQTQKQLVMSDKLLAIGVLSAGIAHEMGNPLASISSLVQLLQRKSSDTKVLKQLGSMREHIERLSTIIHKVTDFAKIDQPTILPVQLVPLLRNTVQLLMLRREGSDIQIQMEVPPQLPRVRGESAQLSQIFSNVLLNACDAISKKGRILVKAEILKGRIVVTIQDYGVGISSNRLKKVFEPFYTTKDVGRGMGMGLSVAYGMVKRFGGDIRIESIVNKGTKVQVYLEKFKS